VSAVTTSASATSERGRGEAAPSLSIALLAVFGLAAFLVASHLEAAAEIASVNPATAVLLAVLALVIAVWTARTWQRPSRALLCTGAVAAAGLGCLWLSTRTVGVPLKAPAGILDTITAGDELLLAVLCGISAFAPSRWSRFSSTTGMIAIGASFVALAMGCSVPAPASGTPDSANGGVVWFCHV
jgi:hypothetical protein